jgi:6-pyruvoyltetrahydropterin/6-carboxytetrahydropterin synthase
MYLKVKRHFDAAHRLCNYPGRCRNLHGHRWEVIATFEFPSALVEPPTNMVADFSVIKTLVDDCLPDHEYLNDFYKVDDPTAEYLSLLLYRTISSILSISALNNSIRLHSIELFESPECSIITKEEDF